MTTPQQRVADALVELASAGPTDESFDVVALLSKLADQGAGLIGADACAVVLAPGTEGKPGGRRGGGRPAAAGRRGRPAPPGPPEDSWLVVSSHPGLRRLEEDATRWGEGAAHECLDRGVPLPDVPLESAVMRRHWPRYSAGARQSGFTRIAALLLSGRPRPLGVVVLLSTGGSALSRQALDIGQSLADVTAHSLLREAEIRRSRTRVAQLEYALNSRILIEQAKGVVATRLAVTMDEAFALLRTHARAHGRILAEVARDVIEGRLTIAEGGPPAAPPGPTARQVPRGAPGEG